MNKDIARKIVANLAYRARCARKQLRKETLKYEKDKTNDFYYYTLASRCNEAYNAYIVSKKILLGLQP